MTASPGADANRRTGVRAGAGGAGLAFAIALGACLARQAGAQGAVPDTSSRVREVPADSSLTPADLAGPQEPRPGDAVMTYGPASDSVVRARCEGATVRRVEVRCLDIFDPLPEGGLRGFYAFANRLHIRTRESTVRSQLLIAAGDVWTADRLRESERLLRELGYIEPEPIGSRLSGDSVDVLVITRDQWTTQPEVNLERGGGRTYGAIGLTEKNLMGAGIALSFEFREDPTGRMRTGSLQGRQVFGTPLEFLLRAGTGTAGITNAVSFRDPFRSLDDPRSWTGSWWNVTESHQLFQEGTLAATFPFENEMSQAEFALGRRGFDGVVRRYAIALAQHDRHYGPTETQPGFEGTFPGGYEEIKLRSASARITLWKPQYIERRGVNRFDLVEDFDVGSLVSFEGGAILKALGSTEDEVLVRLRIDTGRETHGFGFGIARGRVSSRIRGGAVETLGALDARWIGQPRRDLAFVLAAHGEAAQKAPREVQFVVGGLNGLRAFPVHALAGTQVWRFNAETRWLAARGVADLVSLGGALFVDSARAWGTGGDDEPWHHDAGFGLRFSFPHAPQNQVARIDVAFPISPTRDGRREAVLSFGSSQAF